jgi:hypothetical protein
MAAICRRAGLPTAHFLAALGHREDAAQRVSAVAKAHERIHQGDGTDRVDLGIYVEHVCRDLNDAVPHWWAIAIASCVVIAVTLFGSLPK